MNQDIDDHPHRELTEQQQAGVALMGDSSFSELVEKLQLEFCGIGAGKPSRAVVEMMLDFLAESGHLVGHGPSVTTDSRKGQLATIKILEYLYRRHQTPASFAALYVMNVPFLDDLLGHQNQSEFAKSIGVTKAAICKAVDEAAKYFGRPPRSDQRKQSARDNMTNARLRQLKTK